MFGTQGLRALHLRSLIVVVIAASLAAPDELNISGTVSGRTGDPLKGAAVQLKNMTTLAVSSRITDAEGKYRFSSVSTVMHYTDFQIRAVYNGKASKVKRLQWSKARQENIVNFCINLVGR